MAIRSLNGLPLKTEGIYTVRRLDTVEGKIRNLKRLARLNKYNGVEGLEKYNRKLFRYRQKDRKPEESKIKLDGRRRGNGF